jgi:hypothetical protein
LDEGHADLLDALKGLGLTMAPEAVAEVVAALFPDVLVRSPTLSAELVSS